MFSIQKFLVAACLIFIAAMQVHCASSKVSQNENHATQRTGRIMKILKDPKNIRPVQNPQLRRDSYPPPGLKRLLPIAVHRHPMQPHFGGARHQVLRRVQNGPPPNILLRPQHRSPPQSQHPLPPQSPSTQQMLNYEQIKDARYPLNGKEHAGKGAVYRPHFAAGSHPNALPPPSTPHLQHISSNSFNNFKASPQFSGSAIVRPASDYPQYAKLLQDYTSYKDIQQYPLPQQHPQHQHQEQLPLYANQRPSTDTTAAQTFPALHQQSGSTYIEPLPQSLSNGGDSTKKMYSVYEEPERNERAPVQFNSQQNQNQLIYNSGASSPQSPQSQPPSPQRQQQQQKLTTIKEAEEYLNFMSTNEYFLPKFNPNYKKLDEEKDLRQNRQQLKPHQQYNKVHQAAADTSAASTFQHPIGVSQLYYKPNASPTSTIVRGSYQTGNNAFIVKSDGNKATKHFVSHSVAKQVRTTPLPSSITAAYTHLHFNQQRHQTPEPIRFEFTERDAVLTAHTNAPPSNGHLRYNSVGNVLSSVNSASHQNLFNAQTALLPSETFVSHSRPISVNEVDADPEDGDDMQDTSSTLYGRIPIRTSTESGSVSGTNDSTSTTPATEQKDTEDYCERICANVQDDDEEIICGSDGYMYTGEAQMECYASCLHIDVTIQGKGTCSAR